MSGVQLRVHNRLTNSVVDDGAQAMTAHSILSPEQRAELQRFRDRSRTAMETRRLSVNEQQGSDPVARDMEPPSLVAAIQRSRS